MNTIPHNLEVTKEFLADLISKRGIRNAGNQTVRFTELNGGTVVEPTAFEPDPNTHRCEYYYNAITNTLYRKVAKNGQSHWKKISD